MTGSSAARRPVLRALADRLGILPAYVDQGGTWRSTSDGAREALLDAMAIDASTEGRAAQALEEINSSTAARLIPPVRVANISASRSVPVAPSLARATTDWELEVRVETGARHRATGRVLRNRKRGALALRLPTALPPGYHQLRLAVRTAGGARHEAEQSLIVTPARCPTPRELLRGHRVYGLLTNLYSTRSETNWGVGDLRDLRTLVTWSAKIGAAFIGLNPLHALGNRGAEICPYSPVSRLYRNTIYLDVSAVPELAEAPAVRRRIESSSVRARLVQLRHATHVEYELAAAEKMSVLRGLHRVFAARHRHRPTRRGLAYTRYVQAEGQPLRDFATFLALQDHLDGGTLRSRDWHRWPTAYRDPHSAAVRAFAAEHREEIDFHCYLQFELDRQLGGVAAAARSAGLAVGLYQDLALGSSAGGSDTWSFPRLFLDKATVGAPPDTFHARGQNWGLPPLDPRRLVAQGYRYWARIVRAALAHSGAIRVDHVMGLFRQFWIPAGRPPSEGAYVRFPSEDLLGILALESARAGTLVVGEDLGTLPRGLSRQLARWGVLSTRVLYFARRRSGTFWPARAYSTRALVSANTHDMPPLAGFWEGRDIELRRETDQLSKRGLRAARAERARARRALLRRLATEGLLPHATEPPSHSELLGAVHHFLARTPAALVGIALDDLTAETEPVNMPGVAIDRYPSWSRRMRLPVEALSIDPGVRQALAGLVRGPRASAHVAPRSPRRRYGSPRTSPDNS